MFTLKNVLSEGEPGAAGGSAGTPSLTELQATLASMSEKLAATEAETARLRNHSQKLLDEKKGLKSTLEKFGDIDPEKFGDMMKQFENSEEARMLAEGKIDDLVAKRTERARLEAENKLTEFQQQLEQTANEAQTWQKKYNSAVVDQQLRIAAEKAGVLPSAIEDVLARANGVFMVTDEGKLEARDKDGNLKTIGSKPLDANLFVDSLKETAPHYWPASRSGGANGGAGGAANTSNPFMKGSKDYNVTAQAELRRKDPQLADKLFAEAKAAGKG